MNMKITTNDGTIFEGTMAEYEAFLAFAKAYEPKEQTLGTPSDEIEFEGDKYRKVDRKAQAGDVVVFRKNTSLCTEYISVGVPYLALDHPSLSGLRVETDVYKTTGDISDLFTLYEYSYGRTPETVDVYEKVEAEYVPQEGDIVVVTQNTTASNNNVGDIGKLSAVRETGASVTVPNGATCGNNHYLCDFRKATPAEVEDYEKAVAEAAKPKLKAGDFVKITEDAPYFTPSKLYEVFEKDGVLKVTDDEGDDLYGVLNVGSYVLANADEAKWANIGRKPGEFKVGDIVRVIKDVDAKPVGAIFEVTKANEYRVCCNEGYRYRTGKHIELITPAESTFK